MNLKNTCVEVHDSRSMHVWWSALWWSWSTILFIDCLPYEWWSGTSDGLFLPIYPHRSMRVVLGFWWLVDFCNKYMSSLWLMLSTWIIRTLTLPSLLASSVPCIALNIKMHLYDLFILWEKSMNEGRPYFQMWRGVWVPFCKISLNFLAVPRIYGLWGSPGLGGVRTAGLSSSAGLQDYEDTVLKTLSRVRMGLSLVWKTSLVIRICRSPTIVTDSV